jgi:hypothetical protein
MVFPKFWLWLKVPYRNHDKICLKCSSQRAIGKVQITSNGYTLNWTNKCLKSFLLRKWMHVIFIIEGIVNKGHHVG